MTDGTLATWEQKHSMPSAGMQRSPAQACVRRSAALRWRIRTDIAACASTSRKASANKQLQLPCEVTCIIAYVQRTTVYIGCNVSHAVMPVVSARQQYLRVMCTGTCSSTANLSCSVVCRHSSRRRGSCGGRAGLAEACTCYS